MSRVAVQRPGGKGLVKMAQNDSFLVLNHPIWWGIQEVWAISILQCNNPAYIRSHIYIICGVYTVLSMCIYIYILFNLHVLIYCIICTHIEKHNTLVQLTEPATEPTLWPTTKASSATSVAAASLGEWKLLCLLRKMDGIFQGRSH